MDDSGLQKAMEQQALYGEHPIFNRRQGTQTSVSGTTLAIRQANGEITVDEHGDVRVSLAARGMSGQPGGGDIPSLVEEDVRDRVINAIRYVAWLLESSTLRIG